MDRFILALDQGTTSSRAMVFDRAGNVRASAQAEFPQILPAPGVVEHDPEAIWSSQLGCAREALALAGLRPEQIAALGVTNQRETTILWDRQSGQPIANAIVWQSRVSAEICARLKAEGLEPLFRRKTGLLLDPYFSGTKIKYLLERHEGLRARAERGEVLFGTVDTWLIWRLTGGRVHATDPGNASRTLLFDIHTLDWDDELLRLLGVPRAMLPEVRDSSGTFGQTSPEWFGSPIPITAVAGDQQAATFGQACFRPGDVKNTYGTGCFMLMNTGSQPVPSQNNLVTTVGWRLGDQVTYCLEGSVFIAGAVVQWLRDGLHLIRTSAEVEPLAASVPDSGGVVFVPALVGLGAPHWDPYARGTILGITRGTTAAHIARAALESMAYQTRDLLEAMNKDTQTAPDASGTSSATASGGALARALKVDGGAAVNDTLMQFQADVLGSAVERPSVAETTALGAAYLAGLAVGYWNDLDDVAGHWALQRRFEPRWDCRYREQLYARWNKAVRRALSWEEPGE